MKYTVLATIMAIVSGITVRAQDSGNAVDYLTMKMAEIKGEIPRALVDSDMPDPKCGTPVTAAIHLLQTTTGNMALEALDSRPTDLPDTIGNSQILIHYAPSGIDAPYQPSVDVNPADGVPDFINRVLESFEYVWNYETTTLGFRAPLPDNGLGGDNRFDVYVQNLGTGFYGFTTPDTNAGPYTAYCFITIENDFAGTNYGTHPVDGMKVTAAHEFFHAIQFAYDAFEFDYGNINNPNTYRPWWMEASSTWMEDMAYDDINDYVGYLQYFLGFYVWMDMSSFSYDYGDARAFHPYGACVWPIFMTEKYNDPSIVKSIWEICGSVGGYNTLQATETVMIDHGSTFVDAFTEFTVWNFHTGVFADQANFYSEGSSFTSPDTSIMIDSLEFAYQRQITYQTQAPEYLGAKYFIIRTSNIPGGVYVNFNGENMTTTEWHTSLLGYWPGESAWFDMQVGPSSGDGIDEWRDWNNYRYVVVIPSVSGLTPVHGVSFPFTGFVAYDASLVGDADLSQGLKIAGAYPSPYVIDGSGNPMTFSYSLDKRYDKSELEIWIYDASGDRVLRLPEDFILATSAGFHSNGIIWDGKNSDGKNVASGIYIVHMEAGDKSSHIKIAVVNGSN